MFTRDWMNPDEYPSQDAPGQIWAWEFLRRNAEYSSDYEICLALVSQEEAEHGPYDSFLPLNRTPVHKYFYEPPKNDSETDAQWVARCINDSQSPHRLHPYQRYSKKWGIVDELKSPYCDDPPLLHNSPSKIMIFHNSRGDESDWDLSPATDSTKATIIFDLSKPLTAQLTQARLSLKSLKENYRANNATQKISNLWPNYLRAWDAKANGYKSKEIAAVLCKHKQNSADKYNGTQTVDNWTKAAGVLVNKKFLSPLT